MTHPQRVDRVVFRRFAWRQNLSRHIDFGQGRRTLADLIDRNVADPRRIIAHALAGDHRAAGTDIDIGVDHIGAVERSGILLASGFNGPKGIGGRALKPVNLAVVVMLAGCRAGARTIGRTQTITGHPDRLRWFGRIENAILCQPIAEVSTARGTGEDDRIASPDAAIMEANIIPAGRPPDAIGTALITQHTRLIGPAESVGLVEAQIAHRAALGDQHHVIWPALREGDVRDGIAVAGLVAHCG